MSARLYNLNKQKLNFLGIKDDRVLEMKSQMLKAALCKIMGSLMTSRAETKSYLDAIDPSTDMFASNGWYRGGQEAIDKDFTGLFAGNNHFSANEEYIRIDLGRKVYISSVYLTNRNDNNLYN